MPTFHPRTPLPIHLPTFPSSSNPTPISRQHRASTSPAHNQAKPSKITSHEQKSAPIAAKTTEITPHTLTNGRNLSKSQIMSKRGCLTTAKTTRPNNPRTPYAHERTKAGEIASREQKGVPAAAKNSGITPPSAHERAKLTRIARRERKRVSHGHQNHRSYAKPQHHQDNVTLADRFR